MVDAVAPSHYIHGYVAAVLNVHIEIDDYQMYPATVDPCYSAGFC